MDRSDFIRLLEKYTRSADIESQEEMFELSIQDESIHDMDFSSYYLSFSWFADNQFDSCTFHTTKLTDTNFCGNVFLNCQFSENSIRKADWDDLKFIHCSIVSLRAVRVSFLSIIMEDCEVRNAEFTRCYFDPLHQEGQEDGHFSETFFRNCTFEDCTFEDCSFEDCIFDSVEFIGCTFTNTEIDTANPGVHFTDCKFKNSGLS